MFFGQVSRRSWVVGVVEVGLPLLMSGIPVQSLPGPAGLVVPGGATLPAGGVVGWWEHLAVLGSPVHRSTGAGCCHDPADRVAQTQAPSPGCPKSCMV